MSCSTNNCPGPPESSAESMIGYCPEGLELAPEVDSGQLMVRSSDCVGVLKGTTCGYIKFDPETGTVYADLAGLPEDFLNPGEYGYPLWGTSVIFTDGNGVTVRRWCPRQVDPVESPLGDLGGWYRQCGVTGLRPIIIAPEEYQPGATDCPVEDLGYMALVPEEETIGECTTTRWRFLRLKEFMTDLLHRVPLADPDINPAEGDLPAMGFAVWRALECGGTTQYKLQAISSEAAQQLIEAYRPIVPSEWIPLTTPYRIAWKHSGTGVEVDEGVMIVNGSVSIPAGGKWPVANGAIPNSTRQIRLRATAGYASAAPVNCQAYVKIDGYTHAFVGRNGVTGDNSQVNTFDANVIDDPMLPGTTVLAGITMNAVTDTPASSGCYAELWVSHYRA